MTSETVLIKHLSYPRIINLIRNEQELYEENQRIIKEDLNGETFHSPEWRDCIFVFVKQSILSKFSYRFNVIHINIPEVLIYEFNKMFSQLFWKNKLERRTKIPKEEQYQAPKHTIKAE